MLKEAQALFDATMELAAAEREEFVLHADKTPEVREEVLRLLQYDTLADEFLTRPVFETFPALVGNAGKDVAEFRIVRELGRGGMGVVYLAHDTLLDREVALKILGDNLTGSEIAVERFRREAQAAARLSHSAIVPVYRCGEDCGTHFIAMEYVEGETLDHQLRILKADSQCGDSPPPTSVPKKRDKAIRLKRKTADGDYIRRCARFARSMAGGLDYAHHAGVLHRDVKPSNILIDSAGQPRLTDFGIAILDDTHGLTRSGDIPGTYSYMSPEQLACADLDRRSDIFSLGVVLYEMLTLESPFKGENIPAIAESLRTDEPRPIRLLNPAVPKELETICHKALEKKPQDRFPTAAHLAADLDCFLRGEPIMARPPNKVRKVGRWFKRHKAQGIAAAFLFLLTSLGVAGGLQLQHHWESMSSVSISLAVKGPAAVAAVRKWNHDLQRHEPGQMLGPLPIVDHLVEPGSWRFVVTDDDGRFVEFDEVLTAGSEVDRTVLLPDSAEVLQDMVEFPAGMYTVRPVDANLARDDESLYFEGFALDRCEVSNAQYRAFVDATSYPAPKFWELFGQDVKLADRPVVGITVADAKAYALWCGKRLPTAAEWEAAARSPDGRLYPWGAIENTPDSAFPKYDALVAMQSESSEAQRVEYSSRTLSVSVDSVPHATNGLNHLLDNVHELTSTVMPYDPNQMVVKGGSWLSHPQHASLRDMGTYPREQSGPMNGFRCARSVAAPSQTSLD